MEEAKLLASPPTRFKRENHHRTKHDPNFSKWLVLIGPTDWEDHSLRKEGAIRYRVHNLPAMSAPGLYELGLAASSSRLGPEDIVVVYLGQADSVRTRLQSYGRSGAHLGRNCSCNGGFGGTHMGCVRKGPGLFDQVFRRGFSVAFRWTPMKDKRNAERTEAQLLDTFDYAWNKGANGPRRPDDILQKLDDVSSSTIRFPSFSKGPLRLGRGGVGIRIEADKPKGQFHNLEQFQHTEIACGVNLGEGTFCKKPAVSGRKRCEEHKGMKVNSFRSKPKFEEQTTITTTLMTPTNPIINTPSCSNTAWTYPVNESGTCGATLNNGSFCSRLPVQGNKRCWQHKGRKADAAVSGRKRCEEHKGMKVNSFRSKPKAEEQTPIPATLMTPTNPFINTPSCSNTTWTNPVKESGTCGASLNNGSFCRRCPVRGNRRCWQHKGRKS